MDELEAMKKVSDALEDLDEGARVRVLSWAVSKYSVVVAANAVGKAPPHSADESQHGDFADLFHAALPQSHAERALVAAFWIAQESGEPFQSQSLNALLKDLGYQVANITDALSQNMRERPALVVQTKKSGSTRQARKTYKITDAGMRRVKSMMQERNGVSDD